MEEKHGWQAAKEHFDNTAGSLWGYMSGIATIPFVLMGVLDIAKQGTVFLGCAGIAAVVLIVSLYIKNQELIGKLVSDIRVACSPKVEGCITVSTRIPFVNPQGQLVHVLIGRFFRVRVTADCFDRIEECKGSIFEITRIRDMKKMFVGDSQVLTFAPGNQADAVSKTIHEGPEYLDVLFVSNAGEIMMAVPGISSWRFAKEAEMFSEEGDYALTLAIIGKGVRRKKFVLKFHRGADCDKSSIELIDES